VSTACLPQGNQVTGSNLRREAPFPSGLCFSCFKKNTEKFKILINPDSVFFFRFEAGELQRIRSIDEDDRTSLCPPDQVINNNSYKLWFFQFL
jgi:hypothetical protein